MKILFISEKCDMSSFVASSIMSSITQNKAENYYSSLDGEKPDIHLYIYDILEKKSVNPKKYENPPKDITDVVAINIDTGVIKDLYGENIKIHSVSIPIFPDENKERKIEIANVYFDLLYSEIVRLIQKDAIICSCGVSCVGSCHDNLSENG